MLAPPMFIDIFVNWFGDIFNWVFGLIFLAFGMLLGVILIRYGLLRAQNEILYCRERDGRGQALAIDYEDAISIETKSNPPLRFFKWGRSYQFVGRMKRAFTRFFGKEGTAYTWRLTGFSGVKNEKEFWEEADLGPECFVEIGDPDPTQIELEFPTLEEAVVRKWGEPFYKEVPEEMKAKLRENRLCVTVELEPGIVPEGYKPISETVILDKADEDMASLIALGIKGIIRTPWIQHIFVAGTGFAICLALVVLGVLNVPTPPPA